MFYFLFQLREMEKKLSEGKGGDHALIRDGRRVKSSFTSRLCKSFRDRYFVKVNNM